MRIRPPTLLGVFAVAGFALAAHAADDESARCREASANHDLHEIVAACGKAAEVDPWNEKAREAHEMAQAELAKGHAESVPVNLNQN